MKIIVGAASKGGVGKSIVTITTAFALHKMGYKTGLLDTDISMPAVVKYLGLENAELETHKMVEPINVGGVQVLSAGLLMDKDQPVVIGTEKREALVGQFIDKTAWDNLDYLVIDTPPGAVDELQHIVKNHKNDLRGILVITTPSSVAITQVRRSLEMFSRMHAPIVGVIGNMVGFECQKCGHLNDMFKNGSDDPFQEVAHDFKVQIISRFPMYPGIDNEPLHFVPLLMEGLKNVKL